MVNACLFFQDFFIFCFFYALVRGFPCLVHKNIFWNDIFTPTQRPSKLAGLTKSEVSNSRFFVTISMSLARISLYRSLPFRLKGRCYFSAFAYCRLHRVSAFGKTFNKFFDLIKCAGCMFSLAAS